MPDWLVICDGSVPGLLGLAVAADRGGAGNRFWAPPAAEGGIARGTAAARAAQLYSVEPLEAESLPALSDGTGPEDRRVTRDLLAAAFIASERELGVLWPVTAPTGPEALARVTENLNRATLVSRLASLGGKPVEVLTPFADYGDEQLADLVLDMDLPIWTCWWFDPHALDPSLKAAAIAERQRWTSLLHGAGWRGPLPEPKATPAMLKT